MLEGASPAGRDVAERGTAVVLPHYVLLLIAAVAVAAVAQGGYYAAGRAVSAGLVGVAMVLALCVRRWSTVDLWPVLAGGGLAAWAVVRSIVDGSVSAAVPTVLSVVSLVGAVLVVRRTDSAQRELCASVAIGVGVLVAMSGWMAVVWRIPSWVTVADGLVRAGSTLTYPNATAALLAALAVLAVAVRLTRPGAIWLAATYLMLVGLGATLSRAGLLALLVGLVVLSVLRGVRSTARQLAAPCLGAVLAIAALAPSFPIAGSSQVGLATLGLVAGLVIAVGLPRLSSRVRMLTPLAWLVLAAAAAGTVLGARHTLTGRVGLGSPDRGHATSAALDMVAARPLTGVGPGQAWFLFADANGQGRVMRYVHNEYLQVFVELGAIGLALVLCLLAAVFVTVRRGRRDTEQPALWAGAVAALSVLIVHSGFDFLWHIPVILLATGLLIGLAGPTVKERL